MLLIEERKQVVHYCQELIRHGLTKGTGGNISIFNREANLFAISPSGIDYFETEIDDVVIMDINGNIIEGKRKPSSEHELHRIFYQHRNDINAVVHTHSVYSTILATLHEPLPASSYLVAFSGYDVRCADYASFGTVELAQNTFHAMENRNAVFMANHGLLTGANDILNAFNIAEQIEFCAEVYVKARSISQPKILDAEEMERMMTKFKVSYGQRKTKGV